MLFNKLKGIMTLIMVGASLSACSEADPSIGENSLLTLSGQFSSGGQQKLGGLALADYKLYCVTFTSPAYSAESEIDAVGNFSLQIPKQVPFGCFVNDAVNATVASVVVEGAGSGFNSTSSNTMALTGDIHLPNLDLDLDTGKVAVSENLLDGIVYEPPPSFNITDLHQQSYTMSCVLTGDTVQDAGCVDFMDEGAGETTQDVYFRVLEATDNVTSEAVYGLGIWKDVASFQACGSLDMLDSTKADIELDDNITFSSVLSGTAFVADQNLCETREGTTALSHDDVRNYHALGPVLEAYGTYALHVESNFDRGNGCTEHEIVNVSFEGASATDLIGVFHKSSHFEEASPGDCNGEQDEDNVFLVNFSNSN